MIDIYVEDIKSALKNKCFFSALSLALTLPDVCGMVEYPNKQVSERYISWYDKYVSAYVKDEKAVIPKPYLSGEIVYNLRNTYLHQGSPNVNPDKVKEEINQVDNFILLLGDGTIIHEMTLSIDFGPVSVRKILVDVTYLCDILCECALGYYRANTNKFSFDFNIISQQHLLGENSPRKDVPEAKDPIGDLINKKLLAAGTNLQIVGNVTRDLTRDSVQTLTRVLGNQSNQNLFAAKTETPQNKKNITESTPEKKEVVKPTKSKKELKFRSFFGETFKEKKYKDKKEQIVEAFLTSKTKTQLNNRLNRIFPGEDVKVILKRLQPKIKDWHG